MSEEIRSAPGAVFGVELWFGFGLVWFEGLFLRFGLVWLYGLVWFSIRVLFWFGLVWFGLLLWCGRWTFYKNSSNLSDIRPLTKTRVEGEGGLWNLREGGNTERGGPTIYLFNLIWQIYFPTCLYLYMSLQQVPGALCLIHLCFFFQTLFLHILY